MKIPLYKSKLQMTREAPGKSFRARKSMAGPKSILEQGRVYKAGFDQVTEFSKMRYKMITEIKRNEAIIGAKEAIRETEKSMLKSPNFLSVLDKDDKNAASRWDTAMLEIRQRLLENIGKDKFAVAQFNEEFKIAEMNARFRLRDKIDVKIEQRHRASIAATRDAAIKNFSDHDLNLAELGLEIASVTQKLTNSANGNLINRSLVEAIPDEIRGKVTENVVLSYAGDNPGRVLDLNDAMNILESVEGSGKVPASKFHSMPKLPGGNYALSLLLSIPKNEALDILRDALRLSEVFSDAREKADKKNAKIEKDISNRIFTAITSEDFDPGNKVRSTKFADFFPVNDELQNLPSAKEIEMEEGPNYWVFDGAELREYFHEYLSNSGFYTPTQYANMQEFIATRNSETDFVEHSDQATIDMLEGKDINRELFGEAGVLLLLQLKNLKLLSRDHFNEFQARIVVQDKILKTEFREAYNDIRKYIGEQLNVVDHIATKDDDFHIRKRFTNNLLGELGRRFANDEFETKEEMRGWANNAYQKGLEEFRTKALNDFRRAIRETNKQARVVSIGLNVIEQGMLDELTPDKYLELLEEKVTKLQEEFKTAGNTQAEGNLEDLYYSILGTVEPFITRLDIGRGYRDEF